MTWTCQGQTSNGLELSTKKAKTAHNLQVHLWWKEQKRTPSNSCLEKLCQVLAYGQENQNSWPTSSTKQSFLISKIIHVHSSLFIMVSCGKSIIYEENWPRNKIYDWCAWLTLWKAKGNRLKKFCFTSSQTNLMRDQDKHCPYMQRFLLENLMIFGCFLDQQNHWCEVSTMGGWKW